MLIQTTKLFLSLSCNHSSSSMMNPSNSEDDDGVQLCPMSASVTEQADSRFADPVAHTHTCLLSSSRSSHHFDVVVFTVLLLLLLFGFLCCAV